MDTQEIKYYVATTAIIILVCSLIISFAWIFFKYKNSIFTLQQKSAVSHIATLEYERERIAADLHDEIGPTLAAIKMHIELIESNQNIKPLSPLINETIKNISAISKNLVPTSLKSHGLVETINRLIENFKSVQSTNISFKSNYSKCVSIEIELQLYRIIQEAIHNSVKHANASQIDIKLHLSKSKLNLMISDNGKGMKTINNKSISGYGLKSLKNRALIVGGEFDIYTKTGKGTQLQFEIPLNG